MLRIGADLMPFDNGAHLYCSKMMSIVNSDLN